jgi:hypothetical protein
MAASNLRKGARNAQARSAQRNARTATARDERLSDLEGTPRKNDRRFIYTDSTPTRAGILPIFFERELLQQPICPGKSTLVTQRGGRRCKMTSFDEQRVMIRRNKLLGMWVADKLGLMGADAEAYSDALAMDAVDPERNDVLRTIRKDFQAKGVVQPDEQILSVMNESLLKAARQLNTKKGDSHDAAALMIARKLTSR